MFLSLLRSFRRLHVPTTACAVGCILSPLCGFWLMDSNIPD